MHHSVYITPDQAANLLRSCTIENVTYFSPYNGSYFSFNVPTGIPTGIFLWSKEKPRAIYIKKEDLKAEGLSIVHEAKEQCPDLKIK